MFETRTPPPVKQPIDYIQPERESCSSWICVFMALAFSGFVVGLIVEFFITRIAAK